MSLPSERGPQAEQDFEVFVRCHARRILAFCLRRSGHDAAHDAAAEVFAIAWRRFDAVPDGDAAVYWLFGVARRVLANHRRSLRRFLGLASRVRSVAEGPEPSAESVVERSAESHEVNEALRRLKPDDREILTLIVWDEVPRVEVSKLLGISVDAVHKRYQRALDRVEQHLRRGEESLVGRMAEGRGQR